MDSLFRKTIPVAIALFIGGIGGVSGHDQESTKRLLSAEEAYLAIVRETTRARDYQTLQGFVQREGMPVPSKGEFERTDEYELRLSEWKTTIEQRRRKKLDDLLKTSYVMRFRPNLGQYDADRGVFPALHINLDPNGVNDGLVVEYHLDADPGDFVRNPHGSTFEKPNAVGEFHVGRDEARWWRANQVNLRLEIKFKVGPRYDPNGADRLPVYLTGIQLFFAQPDTNDKYVLWWRSREQERPDR